MATAQAIWVAELDLNTSSCGADCDSPYGAMQGKIIPQVANAFALMGGFVAAQLGPPCEPAFSTALCLLRLFLA